MLLTQTPRKFLGFHRTEDRFRPDFAEFYRSYSSFISQCPKTGKFRGVYLHLYNAATFQYPLLKFGNMQLCGIDYKYFSPHCTSFGCIAAIWCGSACHGPHSHCVYSGSEHNQFDSPRLVKREAGFPNLRRVLIGSNQLWRVNDSSCYRE